MDRNEFLVMVWLFLILADLSYSAPNNNSTPPPQNVSVPTPVVAGGKKSDPNLNSGSNTPSKEITKKNVANNASRVDPNGSDRKDSVTPPIGKKKDGYDEKNQPRKEENGKQPGFNGTCDVIANKCKEKELVACVLSFENASKKLVILVQNKGESTLKVNVTVPTSVAALKEFEVPKHKTEMINTSLSVSERTKLVLNAGYKNCELYISPDLPRGSFSYRLASYSRAGIPIYGTHVLFLAALIAGGVWGFCKFRKKRRSDVNSYQELEMGLSESAVPAYSDEPAQGWDEGWDDDWDEDKAVVSSSGHNVPNISGDGFTSRSSNRDGWEVDWDD